MKQFMTGFVLGMFLSGGAVYAGSTFYDDDDIMSKLDDIESEIQGIEGSVQNAVMLWCD